METRDIVYCDASFFEKTRMAILGIVYKNEITRIKAHAKNATVAELLSVLMAKKLYPGKLVVNDCKSISDMFQSGDEYRLLKLLGPDAKVTALLETVNLHGVMWQKRRTSEETCLVDSATRKQLTENFKWRFRNLGFSIKEYGF
jgi:hypothetical protein